MLHYQQMRRVLEGLAAPLRVQPHEEVGGLLVREHVPHAVAGQHQQRAVAGRRRVDHRLSDVRPASTEHVQSIQSTAYVPYNNRSK